MKFEDLHIENQMEQLFNNARTQTPKYAYSDASKMLTTSLALGATTVGHAKLLSSSLFKSKLIIMSVSAVIVTSAVLIYSVTSNSSGASQVDLSNTKKVEVDKLSSVLVEEADYEKIEYNSILVSETNAKPSNNLAYILEPRQPVESNSNPSEFVKTKPSIQTIKTSRQIRFTITERTTLEELNEIKAKAKEAGLALSHSIKIRNNAIRTLNLTIRDENGTLINRYVAGKSLRQMPFSIDLAWSVDNSGKFQGFEDSDAEIEQNWEELYLKDSTMFLGELDRMEELMSLMDPELKTLDSLGEISNQFIEVIDLKSEEIVKQSEAQNKLYKKLYRLESRDPQKSNPSEKSLEEISTLKNEIGSSEEMMKLLETEIGLTESELTLLDLQMETVLNRLDQLDGLLQDPNQLQMMTDSLLSNFDEVQTIYNEEEIFRSDLLAQPSDENLIIKSYLISPSTTETELQSIQKEALDAGMSFSFNAKFKNDKLVFVDISMIIVGTDGKNHRQGMTVGVKRKETFSEPIIWRQNVEGKAIDFGAGAEHDLR